MTANKKPMDTQLDAIIESNAMFKKFRKYFLMEQEGKDEYTIGCIQTANALMPIIAELVLRLVEGPKINLESDMRLLTETQYTNLVKCVTGVIINSNEDYGIGEAAEIQIIAETMVMQWAESNNINLPIVSQ